MGNMLENIMGASSGNLGQMASYAGNNFQGITGKLGLSSTFQAKAPDIKLQDIIADINKVKDQPTEIQRQQQGLANALLAQSQGQGPNPAAIALQQATDRNIQQGAGMIASQKGVNPALAGRMAAQNAAMQSQQAAGQGAKMQAEQQLGAQGQLGNVYGQMANQSLQNLNILQDAQAAQNNAINTGSLGAQQINSGVSMGNAQNNQKVLGSIASAAGGAAKGGAAHGAYITGGEHVPAMVSPGEIYLPPEQVAGVKHGDKDPLLAGERIQGKAKVKGDSEVNDTVPKNLEPGGVVIPRTKAQDSAKAKEFVQRLKDGGKVASKGYGAILEANRKLEQRIAALEKRLSK